MASERKKRQIMRKAETLFASRRFHEITLDEVALAAGIGKGTIYRYFDSKEALYSQTVVAGLDELTDLLEQKVPVDVPFRDRLLAVCREISDFHHGRRSLFLMIQAEEVRLSGSRAARHTSWVEHRKKILSILERILLEGVREGKVRDDIPPSILGSFLLGMIRTRVRSLEYIPEELRGYETLVDLFLSGASGPGKHLDEEAKSVKND